MIGNRTAIAAVAAIAVTGGLALGPAALAAAAPGSARAAAAPAAAPPPDRVAAPDQVLAPGWRSSRDRAVTVAGDAAGLRLLAADEADGYAWRTVANLAVQGVDTTQWIGQACVTGSGAEAVVVYAPRQITSMGAAQGFGALAAVVNLDTGAVTRLAAGVSISYSDPGCGTGEQAVLSRGLGQDAAAATRLMTVDASLGRITSSVDVAGQLTSAVPFGGAIAAVRGHQVIAIDAAGRAAELAVSAGQPFRLAPDAAGGLAFQVAGDRRVELHRYAAGRDQVVATTDLGAVELSQDAGRVWVTGPRASGLGNLPAGWRALDAPALADVSTEGALALTSTVAGPGAGEGPAPDAAQPVAIDARVTATGKAVDFTVAPDTGSPPASAETAQAPATGAALASDAAPNPAAVTFDPDRTCSVPRNDPRYQTYQPSPAQEEWAVDQAVRGRLTGVRGPNLYQSGLPAYTPQGLFPLPGLDGGGSVPAQVVLGILAQESAEYQASSHAIIGQTGNFLSSFNWYGGEGDFTVVDWAKADCGYGAAQITSGMCMSGNPRCPSGDVPMLFDEQVAVAIDYQANIAAGLRILEQKWNELRGFGVTANGGDPQFLENWWFALWDYNSGWHPQGSGQTPSAFGLGWVNNPANPMYPPDREMFLSGDYNFDVSHPMDWSYEEKVIGFADFGLFRLDFIAQKVEQAYALGRYADDAGRKRSEPPKAQFCNGTDTCDPSTAAAPCQDPNLDCWWHEPATWLLQCSLCGVQSITYAAGAPDPGSPGVPAGYAPECSSAALPRNAVIVDDVPASAHAALGCPGQNWTTKGTMTWRFGSTTAGGLTTYPSKVDLHQLGAGFGGHVWFTHTTNGSVSKLDITGTWTPPASVTGWTRIKVHIPNEGAWTRQADYHVNLGGGRGSRHRVVNQLWLKNTWVDIGVFDLARGASVSLGSVTRDGTGEQDIAWDAVAFVPTVRPTVEYVAVGDSYSSGEGVPPYEANSAQHFVNGGVRIADDCHRSALAYSRLIALPGHARSIAAEAATGDGTTAYADLTCSGALTTSVTNQSVDARPTTFDLRGNTDWGHPDAHFGEIAQVDQGYLDADTTLVTVTTGGDDARFADIVRGCIIKLGNCSQPGFRLKRHSNGAVDPADLAVFEPEVINQLLPKHLLAVYAAIHAAAPHARIIVLGYPKIAAPKVSTARQVLCLMEGSDLAALNRWGDDLQSAIKSQVLALARSGAPISFIDPNPLWASGGGHWACGANGARWVNGPTIGSQAFHPNQSGQRAFATLVDARLAGRG